VRADDPHTSSNDSFVVAPARNAIGVSEHGKS